MASVTVFVLLLITIDSSRVICAFCPRVETVKTGAVAPLSPEASTVNWLASPDSSAPTSRR
jgi:hypothetical protein